MDELLIKLIIAAIFLVFWVLNQLFGQENKATLGPARGQPLGPRPPVRLPPPAPRPVEAPVARDPTLRWPSPSGSESMPSRSPAASRDEDVLVIRPEISSRSSSPRPGGGTAPTRRPPRAKTPPSTAAKRAELGKARPATSRLASPGSAPDSMPAPSQAAGTPMTNLPGTAAVPSLAGLLLATRSPAQLREAFVLSELLQPPLALRSARRR
jgi:hypothetical protein